MFIGNAPTFGVGAIHVKGVFPYCSKFPKYSAREKKTYFNKSWNGQRNSEISLVNLVNMLLEYKFFPQVKENSKKGFEVAFVRDHSEEH